MPTPDSLCFDAACGGLDLREVIRAHSYAVFVNFISKLTGKRETTIEKMFPLETYNFHELNYDFLGFTRKYEALEFDPFVYHDDDYYYAVFKKAYGLKLNEYQQSKIKKAIYDLTLTLNESFSSMCGMFDYCEVECSYLIAFFEAARRMKKNKLEVRKEPIKRTKNKDIDKGLNSNSNSDKISEEATD